VLRQSKQLHRDKRYGKRREAFSQYKDNLGTAESKRGNLRQSKGIKRGSYCNRNPDLQKSCHRNHAELAEHSKQQKRKKALLANPAGVCRPCQNDQVS
jgi:hypothetical protein